MIHLPDHQALVRQLLLEVVGERHLRRRHRHHADVELGEGVSQRVHGPHAHVADAEEGETVDSPQLPPDRVQVGEHLGRMLPPAVAGVDDGDRGPAGRLSRGPLGEMTHHDDVAVVLEHVDGVFDRLLIEVTGPGHAGVGEPGDGSPQAQHGGLVGEPGAGGRLVEGGDQGLGGQQVAVAALPGDGLELVGHGEEMVELGSLEPVEREDVTSGEAPHRNPFLRRRPSYPPPRRRD